LADSIVGLICARGGSKGVPRKNVRLLGGKPLIAWSIEVGRGCPSIGRIIVSTEDDEIASIARQYGAEVPFVRPAVLALDNSPEWHVWQHALRTLLGATGTLPRLLVVLPPTSPMRSIADVEACIAEALGSDADVVITVKPAERNPYFNMVELHDGYVQLAARGPGRYARRQDAPAVYDMTTVAYAARPEFVMRAGHLFDGKMRAVIVPPERAVDIDTELDLAFAEFLLRRQQ